MMQQTKFCCFKVKSYQWNIIKLFHKASIFLNQVC